jgi:hypothetical protein
MFAIIFRNIFMKKNSFIAICNGLSLILTSCTKNGTRKQSNPPLITGKVIEFGSGLPIAGVNFSYDLCVRPAFLGCARVLLGGMVMQYSLEEA